MSATAILRTRIDPRRKARVEKILDQLGMTSTQAVNMFFAQIEHVARVWRDLDQTDFSHLDKR